jgi:unsaturated chondroitin disaccharide hydrolase
MQVTSERDAGALAPKIDRMWDLSAAKIRAIERRHGSAPEVLVHTVNGRYTGREWTAWTLGFRIGSALLQFDATGDRKAFERGRRRTIDVMPPHLTDAGVHDHGFQNVSTYGNLLRLAREQKYASAEWERRCYETALRCSGAVQARRWTDLGNGQGFIHSFNGPQSLFVDTIRSLRSLAIAHRLGQVLLDEGGRQVSLLDRLVTHARTTARYLVDDGTGRDVYTARGRVAHEAVFSPADGSFRCLSSQQGYSPFTTWTRGLAWAMCGFAELIEFLETLTDAELRPSGGRRAVRAFMLDAACATCDSYIAHTPADGIPYWDDGAPGLQHLGDYLSRPADPFNAHEPVDSSAAAIAAQGLLRLGHVLGTMTPAKGGRYWQAGLAILDTLLGEPYLSRSPKHEGLLLHALYHRPRGWDASPAGGTVPCGESVMWGDYHLREVALYVQRIIRREPYLTFWGPT